VIEIDGLYEEYSDLVYKYIYRLSENYDVAEELTQETFYQAVRTIGRFRGDCKMSSWLCQIAKHTWYKYLEKKNKNKQIPLEDIHNTVSRQVH